jgi:hypothetical protein
MHFCHLQDAQRYDYGVTAIYWCIYVTQSACMFVTVFDPLWRQIVLLNCVPMLSWPPWLTQTIVYSCPKKISAAFTHTSVPQWVFTISTPPAKFGHKNYIGLFLKAHKSGKSTLKPYEHWRARRFLMKQWGLTHWSLTVQITSSSQDFFHGHKTDRLNNNAFYIKFKGTSNSMCPPFHYFFYECKNYLQVD